METTSRNSVSKRDTLSEWRPKRKAHPGIQPQSGTPFPVETTCLDICLRPLLFVDGYPRLLVFHLSLLIEKELELRIVERLSSFSKTNS